MVNLSEYKRYICIQEYTGCYDVDGYGGSYPEPFTIQKGMHLIIQNNNAYYPELDLLLNRIPNLEFFKEI